MLSRDDIFKMAREAGFKDHGNPELWDRMVAADEVIERFFKRAYEAGAKDERERLISEGWRQCAQGQKTSQFCAVAEQARLEEREACALIAEAYEPRCDSCPSGATNAIRARGQQQEPDDANPSFG